MASFRADMAQTDELVRARLRALRLERGLSQEEVAERAGMAASTLSRLESGARRLALDHLTPLAGALGVEVGDLLAPATRDPRVRERERTVDGIVIRTVHPEVPPKVEYRLTDWGQSLCPALDQLLTWAENWPDRAPSRPTVTPV